VEPRPALRVWVVEPVAHRALRVSAEWRVANPALSEETAGWVARPARIVARLYARPAELDLVAAAFCVCPR
jgi:hypothetical protein